MRLRAPRIMRQTPSVGRRAEHMGWPLARPEPLSPLLNLTRSRARSWGQLCVTCRGLIMPRYPKVFVNVTDGKPLEEILERVDDAMRKAGVSTARRSEFKACMPLQYALAVDYIRQWVNTD